MATYDVIVVGAGNAALCAALSARERNKSVLVLERAPEAEKGGNSRYTAGAMRFVYENIEDLMQILPDLTSRERTETDFGRYTRNMFYDDMGRMTQYRCDPDLVEVLVENSYQTVQWMHKQGVRFMPMYSRQAFRKDGRMKFWGGLAVEAWGGGEGLISTLHQIAKDAGIDIQTGSRVTSLCHNSEGITGVQIQKQRQSSDVSAETVILACGGFEANTEWRTRYLGPGWELAKVRGTRFNTGDGIRMAMDIGAAPHGNWSGCHAVAWDNNAPETGDLTVGDGFQKHSYPFGIMVNANGDRFVDEGADFRNYTYAKYGREILAQPNQFAWQIFDGQVEHLLRDEYRIRQVTRVTADTLAELSVKLTGVESEHFLETVQSYNQAVKDDVPFDPTVKDGRCTTGLAINKSNWANRLIVPPFSAYQITCGITFTFGGLRINPQASVIDTEGDIIPGLFACGELVGGLFYFNYPGGSGLTSGAVFGKVAGQSAANYVDKQPTIK